VLKDIKNNEKFSYLVGENGQVYVSKTKDLNLPKDKVVIASNSNEVITGTGKETAVIREAGEILYDSDKKQFAFKPTYGFDTSGLQVKHLLESVQSKSPGFKFDYKPSAAIPHARTVKCLDVMSAQSSGKNFVLDRYVSDNIVLAAGVVGGEVAGAGRMDTHTGRMVVLADAIGGNISTGIGATIGKKLIVKDANLATSMAVRTGMGLSLIEMQKQIHKGIVPTDPNAKSSSNAADDIATFNRAHFFARLPVNHYFDKFVVKTLPNVVFNACQKNPKLAVLISPSSVRLYERYASSTLYYAARGHFTGN
jgi:hypothetical protein